jgi:hypothetical protein
MIHNNDLAFLIFVVIELGNVLVSLDVCSWKIECFSDMILFVFLRFSEIDEYKIGLETYW